MLSFKRGKWTKRLSSSKRPWKSILTMWTPAATLVRPSSKRGSWTNDAVAQYKKTLEINPNYAQANYNLGLVLFQKGQLDDAIAHYQKAVKINPYHPGAHNNFGNALLQKGQVDEAVDKFQ